MPIHIDFDPLIALACFCDLFLRQLTNDKIIKFIIQEQFDTDALRDDFENILFCADHSDQSDDEVYDKYCNIYQISQKEQCQSIRCLQGHPA